MERQSQNPYQAAYEPSQIDDNASGVDASVPLFEATVHTLRKGFFPMFACYFVIHIPLELCVSYIDYNFIAEENIQQSFRLDQLTSNFIGIISIAAIIRIAHAIYDGNPFSIAGSLAGGIGQWVNIFTTRFCVNLITVFGLLFLLFPGIYFWVRSAYAESIAIAENVNGPTAITRSFNMTKGRFGETLLMCIVFCAILMIGMVPFMGLMIAFELSLFAQESWRWIVEGVLAAMLAPIFVLSSTFFYCGYRKLLAEKAINRPEESGLPDKLDFTGSQLPD